MSVFHIENKKAKVSIDTHGAELQSFYHKTKKKELIWNADPKHWNKHSPILFPIIGKLENDAYKLGSKTIQMSKHGFARDKTFELSYMDQETLIFKLEYSNETLLLFPFKFELLVQYQLKEDQLEVEYTVNNIDESEMYFNIGAHPGFNLKFSGKEKISDYRLEFEEYETADQLLLTPDGFLSGERKPKYLKKSNTLNLKDELFENDAIIFDQLKSSFIIIKNKTESYQLKFGWRNFPHMGIWKPLKAPFICLEPWNGMADQKGAHLDFKKKKGIITLQPKASFNCGYSIELI